MQDDAGTHAAHELKRELDRFLLSIPDRDLEANVVFVVENAH
jgi:hypothetical protein